MSNAHTNGKSCTPKQYKNTTGEVYTSPTLVWEQTMHTHANTLTIVLAETQVSVTEYSHNMDDTDTQTFTGNAKFMQCLTEIIRKDGIHNQHKSNLRKHFYRITCVNADGRQNYSVRDFSQFLSLVALEIGSLVQTHGKNIDPWWKSSGTNEEHSSLIIGNFAEQMLEVGAFLKHQKFLNELKEHEKTQSE